MLTENLVGDPGHEVGQSTHVDRLNHWPFPALRFSFDHSQGTHALHGKHIKDQQRVGGGRSECFFARTGIHLGSEFFPNSEVVFKIPSNAINGGNRRDKYFPCRKGSNECNSNFPIVSQGLDGRLNRPSHDANE